MNALPNITRSSDKNDEADAALPSFSVEKTAKSERYLKRLAASRRERLRWHEALLRLPAVWRASEGKGVKIAILDTGIDTDHPDLQGNIIAARDFTGEGIEDGNGHGTHCAGIIGARRNNIGFVGAAPQASLMIGKVLRNDGRGRMHSITAGVHWAMDEGADIISMSLGSPRGHYILHEAVHEALADGRILICAAGNSGHLYANNIGYPGRYGSVITVGSHDRNGLPSGFSSRGAEVDFLAPGDGIWSTYKNGGYARLSGTSMATPFAAGLAALVLSRHRQNPKSRTPIHNNDDMRQHLARMASHPGYHEPGRGHGPLLPFSYFSTMA